MDYKKHFIPLESDPEIFTQLMHDLGVSRSVRFVDVWSLEDDILACIPRPVLALILVLPPCPAYERLCKVEGGIAADPNEERVVWLKQTINNACGLYAILHAVCNLPALLEPESSLHRLAELNPSNRVKYLEDSKEIEVAYAKAAQRGTSEAPCAEDEVDHHYICLVKHCGQLYELDGDIEGPTNQGFLAGDDILTGSALDIIRRYMESEKDGMFGLLALVED